jgi:hypothetical protein
LEKQFLRGDKKCQPTKQEREVIRWLRHFTSHLDVGRRIDGIPKHLNTNSRIASHFVNLHCYSQPDCPIRKKHRRTYLQSLRTRQLREHSADQETYYFTGSYKPEKPALIMIDVDCHRKGNLQGALAFASWLRSHHFANLYYEPSTNGKGAHAYLVIDKSGFSIPALKHLLFRRLQPWLNEQAKGFDIELVEIKGLPPECQWGNDIYDLKAYKAGTLAKIPRGIFDRFDELRTTTVVSAWDLCQELPDEEPKAEKAIVAKAGSFSGKHIDCSKLDVYRQIARDLLQGEIIATNSRHIVTEEDVAIFILLAEWFSKNMNADGSLPYARFKGLWDACYTAGDISRAFNCHRFAAIRNKCEEWELLSWEDNVYDQNQACKWRFSDAFLGEIEQYKTSKEHPLQPQVFVGFTINYDPNRILLRPIMKRYVLEDFFDPSHRFRIENQLMSLCA